MATRPIGCFFRRVTCDYSASGGGNAACSGGHCTMGCGNAREHLMMMKPSAVSLFLLGMLSTAVSAQTVPVERSAAVPKAGEKLASSASPTMLEGFLRTQASELLS